MDENSMLCYILAFMLGLCFSKLMNDDQDLIEGAHCDGGGDHTTNSSPNQTRNG